MNNCTSVDVIIQIGRSEKLTLEEQNKLIEEYNAALAKINRVIKQRRTNIVGILNKSESSVLQFIEIGTYGHLRHNLDIIEGCKISLARLDADRAGAIQQLENECIRRL